MISRVAESCFWLTRYVERIESLSRLLYINQTSALDGATPEERWKSLIIVTGEEERFDARPAQGSEKIEDAVEDFLTWDEENQSSIYSSLFLARENARTIREIISREMWETINEAWVWIRSKEARSLYKRDRYRFFLHLRHTCTLFHGYSLSTMLHESSFDFMRLGSMLERAGQTARTLDVKYHVLGRTYANMESPEEAAQWLAILYSCSGVEPFFKRENAMMSGKAVAHFLIFDPKFPRSILHCLERARNFLTLVKKGTQPGVGKTSDDMMKSLLNSVASRDIDSMLKEGLHVVLTRIIDETTEVCTAIYHDFFNPMVSEPRKAG